MELGWLSRTKRRHDSVEATPPSHGRTALVGIRNALNLGTLRAMAHMLRGAQVRLCSVDPRLHLFNPFHSVSSLQGPTFTSCKKQKKFCHFLMRSMAAHGKATFSPQTTKKPSAIPMEFTGHLDCIVLDYDPSR